MLLTYGNIKKSRMLRYVFHDDLSSEDYARKMEQYRQTMNTSVLTEYLKVERFLHDAKVTIEKFEGEIIFHINGWNQESNKTKNFDLVFRIAKIVSWNKFRSSGHISRMNREVIPYEYGYDEFYTHNSECYVSILIFTNFKNRTNVGVWPIQI